MNNTNTNTNIAHSGSSSTDIKAIIFDIDGTLYSNTTMCLAQPLLYLRNILWIFRFSKMRKLLRTSLKAISHDTLSENFAPKFWNMSIDLFKNNVKCSKKESALLLQKHIYDTWIHGLAKTPLRLGMRLLLGELRRNGIKLGILSDFKPKSKIDNWGLSSYFEAVVCAEDYGLLKPDTRIFHVTCDLLKCKPEEVMFVGNHLRYDGLGAANAGMKSVLIYHKSSLAKYVANKHGISIVRSVAKLRTVFREAKVLMLLLAGL